MTQQWTKTPPSEPGWYWIISPGGLLEVTQLRTVTYKNINKEICCLLSGDDNPYKPNFFANHYWLGPIELPELPEEA